MKLTKVIIPIGWIKVHGITQTSVKNCIENCLKILLHMQEKIDIISCVLWLHTTKKTSYEDEEISIGDMPIPKNSTTEALEALGATLKNYWYLAWTVWRKLWS